jgi:hypothetical protein
MVPEKKPAKAIREPPGPPPFSRVYKIQSGNRLRIDKELAELVSWLGTGKTERVAMRGPRGGIVLVAPETAEAAVEEMEPGNLREEDADTKLGDQARHLSMRWTVSFSYEPGKERYSITLPEGLRRFGFLPGAGEDVVVFVSGGIFEIWEPGEWKRYHTPQAPTAKSGD